MPNKSDFNRLHDMPAENSKLNYSRIFNSEECIKLKEGLSSQSMEEKWIAYTDNSILYMHRSWTGHCIYSVSLIETNNGCKAEYALVNRNSEHYNANDDSYDLLLLDFLISNLILGEKKPFPNKASGNEPPGIVQHVISGTGYKEVTIRKPWWKFW